MTFELPGGLALPEGWKAVRLGDIAIKVRSGATPKGGAESYLPYRSNYVLIRSQNVFDHYFDETGLANISDDQARGLAGAEVEEGDVLLNITGDGVTFGRACIVPKRVLPASVNQHVMLIRLDQLYCLPEYLLAWLNLPLTKRYIESFNAGGSRRAITKGHIESFVVPLPPIAEQRAIAGFVSVINDRIELVRDMNSILESIAQAIFKSWFSDFDPVRAQAEGRQPEGMDAETAALFPSEFEESELGIIPQGWRAGTLADLSHLSPESWNAKSHPEALSYVDLGNTKENRINQVLTYTWEEAPSRARRVLRAGDTIVGTVRPGNRSYAFVAEPTEGLTGSTGFAVLRPKLDSLVEFVYLAATREENIERLANLADGGAYPAVSPELVHRTSIAVPPMPVLVSFSSIVGPMFQRISCNREMEGRLTEIRDTLLPQLISGALRVHEAEAALTEVLA